LPAATPSDAARGGSTDPAAPGAPPPDGPVRRLVRDWATRRKPGPIYESLLLGAFCVAACLGLWWFLTRGEAEERIVSPTKLPSVSETFKQLPDLWFKYALTRNTLTTLKRVALGFLLAIVIGVPLGVLAGCFPRFAAFLSPLVMFGRNIPLAAVLPLMIYLFVDGETRKMMFIFFACVAFIVSDAARAIADVGSRYVDTAYTLGASRWQTIIKVLVPAAMPQIFDSFRILFGLAFGYIMLAESIKYADDVGGLGFQIQTFQRLGHREEIYLIILIIPIVALAVDRLLYWIQRQLFPHVYGGDGMLQSLARVVIHAWDDLKRCVYRPALPAALVADAETAPARQPTP
jgi:NitT/TauT family transport system permease protein